MIITNSWVMWNITGHRNQPICSMVLEYLPTFTSKITQLCRFLYTSTIGRASGSYTIFRVSMVLFCSLGKDQPWSTPETSQALAMALHYNRTLLHLRLDLNKIRTAGAKVGADIRRGRRTMPLFSINKWYHKFTGKKETYVFCTTYLS